MAGEKTSILFPTGLLIWGDVRVPETKDMQGNPLMTKTGPNAGKPTQRFAIGVAFKKGPEAAQGGFGWAYTPWGAQVLAEARKSFPGGETNRRDFAWKIIDGDSQEFNQGNPPKKFCDIPNYAGHWVVKFSSSFAPQVVNENGTIEVTDPDYLKAGDYVQVFGSVEGNGNAQKPGMYMNLQITSFQGRRPEGRITAGPNAATVGFGAGGLMPGATLVPAGAMSAAQAQAAPGGLPTPPAAATALPQLPGAAPAPAPLPVPGFPAAAPAVASLPVMPDTSMVTLPGVAPGLPGVPAAGLPQVPGVPMPAAAPALPVPPPVARGPVMTAKAQGAPIEAFRAQGWTDDALLREGYAVMA